MSAKGSENAFIERDDGETEMDFDDGGVPFYVAIVWIIFLTSFMAYMAVYALPDWSAWSAL